MTNKYSIEVVLAPEGLEVLKINGYYTHSRFKPLEEAETFVGKNYQKQTVHILFGYGSGYIVEAFRNKLKEDDCLVVIDPIIENFNIYSDKIVYINSKDIKEVKEKLNSLFNVTQQIKVICSPNYDKICNDFYTDILRVIKDKLMMDKSNENTIVQSSTIWQKNFLDNLINLTIDQSLEVLMNSYNMPVIVASGGPSLTKQLPLLKVNREKFIIIAAGSTINSLLEDGIEPDYVVSIDGGEANYLHFKDLKLSKHTKFIYSMYSHSEIRKCFKSSAYYFVSDDTPDNLAYLEDVLNVNAMMLPSNGTVAQFAFHIATLISTGPVAFIGQDLAYTNNESHAKNNRLYTEYNNDLKNNPNVTYATGYYDDEVLTNYTFLSMRDGLEKLAKELSIQTDIYNCTEGGIKINGIKQLSFAEFCEKYAVNNQVVASNNQKNCEQILTKNKLINQLDTEVELYKKIQNILRENLILIKRNKSDYFFEKSILNQLDRNDKKLLKYRQRTALCVSYNPVWINVLKNFKEKNHETEQEAYLRVKSQNNTLYSSLIEVTSYTQNYTKKVLANLKEKTNE